MSDRMTDRMNDRRSAVAEAPTPSAQTLKEAKMKPCCLAISAESAQGIGDQGQTRKWRVLSLDDQSELATGHIDASFDDLLMIVREKAATAARGIGYDPQKFVLECAESYPKGSAPP